MDHILPLLLNQPHLSIPKLHPTFTWCVTYSYTYTPFYCSHVTPYSDCHTFAVRTFQLILIQ